MGSGSVVGAYDQDGSDAGMFTSQGNSFDSNVYRGIVGDSSFYWNGAGSFAAFQAKRQELHGSLKRFGAFRIPSSLK